MEGNPPIYARRLVKSTFKDILISANNDDVIIPVSATFDTVVFHIGIGTRSGVFIEKPPEKYGKNLNTSVEYATRKFTESRKGIVVPGEEFRKDKHIITDIDVDCHFSAEQATNTSIALDKQSKTCVEEFKASILLDKVCKTIDRAYENEMLAIAIDKEAGFLQPKEFLPHRHTEKCLTLADTDTYMNGYFDESERGCHIFANGKPKKSEEKLSEISLENQTNVGIDSSSVKQEKVTSPKTATGDRLDNVGRIDHNDISEIFILPTFNKENDYITSLESFSNKAKTYEMTKSDNTSGGSFADKEEREIVEIVPNSVSEQFDGATSLASEISDTETLGTVTHIELSNFMDNEALETNEHLDQSVSTRDTFDDIEADDSVIDDKYYHDDDELSDSDTLNDVIDIELDDDDMVDIEAIALRDQDEIVTEEINDFADSTTNDDAMFEDGDNIFGIMKIYINSDLHFDMDKKHIADNCAETRDFGYKFFSFESLFE